MAARRQLGRNDQTHRGHAPIHKERMHARYNLFACVGGIYRARRAGDEGMLKFMNQTPRHVARFVSECLQLRDTKPDLTRHFEDYPVDLFSSDGDG